MKNISSITCYHSNLSYKRGFFTLVELLVVVAIIAILAALLMPALKGALDSARGVKCVSNFKTIGQNIAMYADTFNNRLPRTQQKVNGTNATPDFGAVAVWESHLAAFTLNFPYPSGVTSYNYQYRNYNIGLGSPFTCPSVVNALPWHTQKSSISGQTYEFTMCSATYNKTPAGYQWDNKDNFYTKIPGKSIIIYEKTIKQGNQSIASAGTNTTPGNANIQVQVCTDTGYNKGGNSPGFRHQKKANMLRADGAVRTLQYGVKINDDWTF